MADIKTYNDIGEKILKSLILKEKYDVEMFDLAQGKSELETVLRVICREKEKTAGQESSSTMAITNKLNQLFKIGG